ncbi:flavodoxin family protein [Selenomonadales bacterium OttesenSCG-928-I06]|nr:flavodoxin family protein [Selenomonadales bacterium OttesenSCG-928-I06]
MKNLIVYSSLTGNTKMVAEAIHSIAPKGTEIFPVEDMPNTDNYDVVAVGFWVDKGTSDKKATEYLTTIKNKKVALFATAGVSPETDHAKQSLVNAAKNLAENNTVIGTFICQGKIDPKLLEAFKNNPENQHHKLTPERIARHKQASTHPDENDLKNAKDTFTEIFKNL